MISIARKNLSSLFLNPNSFLRNSSVPFFPSIHPFSTSKGRRLIYPRIRTEIFDVLVNKHHISPELASLASSSLPEFRSPERVDLVLSFLKENSFTTVQLEKIVAYDPKILGFNIEDLKFKLKVFQDLGLAPEEIAKVMSTNQSILRSSMSNRIIPKLSVLKGLLGSNEEVARLLKRSAWFLSSDLEKTLMPNVEIFKSCGIPMERILGLLYSYSRFMLIKPDIMRKSVDRAIEFGFSSTSVTFIHAATVFSFTSKEMWEVKMQILRDLGISDDDIVTMFRKQPMALSASTKKLKSVIELLLATGKYNISNIVSCPVSLGCSIEKRLEPRLRILSALESRSLIEKWPPLSTISYIADDKFFDRFVRPCYDEIGEEYITQIYFKGKRK